MITIKRHPGARKLKGVKGQPSLLFLLRMKADREMSMLSEIDRLTRAVPTAWVEGAVAERGAILDQLRGREAMLMAQIRRRPGARWLQNAVIAMREAINLVERRCGTGGVR